MLELRILNGLHRGATLPLDGQAVHIGAGDEADVVMADHGIESEHARLAPHGDGWLLTASGGAIYAAGRSDAQELVELRAGDCARVGDIWISVCWPDAPWEAPPPLPEPEPACDAREAHAGDTAAPAPVQQEPPRPHANWRRRGAGALLALVAAMLAATAYALTTRPDPVALQPVTTQSGAPKPPARAGKAAAPPKAPEKPEKPDLAALFRKRLADADLLNRFDLSLGERAWSMQAHLDDEESARFERILGSFIKEHDIRFPVKAKAVTAEAMLPFRIGQVISGANASIVTQDGARLYVGDDYKGVRVVAIQPSRATFFGKRKIEVIW
ncbi:hypothetical protein HF313_16635 [Massilia atriviolacea]|uniref:Uncharacterized protein n=1 Tax=Massilia atriviolacea TaxID=2495579 RepID=A0A430HU05_9BURK|nr:FHA domain-containing protein [Massilia atriviolacea]RSZ61068.1 hypothetical protein EJB06_02775 [Massilia atriviolacea]